MWPQHEATEQSSFVTLKLSLAVNVLCTLPACRTRNHCIHIAQPSAQYKLASHFVSWRKKGKFLWSARSWQCRLLEQGASAIEMQNLANLDKIFDWGIGMARNHSTVSLRTLYPCEQCSCHWGCSSQSDPPGDLPVRNSAGLFRAPAFTLGLVEELVPVVSCAVVKL